MRVDWMASGACTSGSIALPRDATRRASGGGATTSTPTKARARAETWSGPWTSRSRSGQSPPGREHHRLRATPRGFAHPIYPLLVFQVRFDERLRRLRQRLGRALPAAQGLAARIGAFDQKEERVRELRGPARADGISQPEEPPQH